MIRRTIMARMLLLLGVCFILESQEYAKPPQKNTDVYIVVFKGAPPFNPARPKEFLDAFNERHQADIRTHHFRTQVSDEALVGRICVDGAKGKDALVNMPNKNPRLVFIDCIKATPETLEKHYRLRRVSLPNRKTPPEKAVPREDGPQMEFSLTDALGRVIHSDDYTGVPVLVLAGACWCGGCQQDAEPLRILAQKYMPRGLQVIRSISGDNELSALEFQKHYRLPIVHLMDSNREFEKRYNRDGWTFLMLANRNGKVIYRMNSPQEKDWQKLLQLLDGMLPDAAEKKGEIRDGVSYMPATLARSGESKNSIRRDLFPSVACDRNGRVFVVFTSVHNGNYDIMLRVFDGKSWLDDQPIAATKADEFDGRIAIDQKNGAWLTWTSNTSGDQYDIHICQISEPGAEIKPAKITASKDDAMHARLACDQGGRIWVAYYQWRRMQGRSRDKEVYTRFYDGDHWSDEIHVSPEDVPEYEDHADPTIIAHGDSVVVGWSWDFHRPKGYSPKPRDPTIFLRKVSADGDMGRIHSISMDDIDTSPTLAAGTSGLIYCAWESVRWNNRKRANYKHVNSRILDMEANQDPDRGSSLSGLQKNVCSPCLALSPSGAVTIVWSEMEETGRWILKRADLDTEKKAWTSPQTLVSQGQPRYPSAAYDQNGALWIAYSIEKNGGRSVSVFLSTPE